MLHNTRSRFLMQLFSMTKTGQRFHDNIGVFFFYNAHVTIKAKRIKVHFLFPWLACRLAHESEFWIRFGDRALSHCFHEAFWPNGAFMHCNETYTMYWNSNTKGANRWSQLSMLPVNFRKYIATKSFNVTSVQDLTNAALIVHNMLLQKWIHTYRFSLGLLLIRANDS